MSRALVPVGLTLALALSVTRDASAHKPSDSYLRLGAPRVEAGALQVPLRWDVALRDLDRALGLDGNRDDAIT